jgi:hypothetical protein
MEILKSSIVGDYYGTRMERIDEFNCWRAISTQYEDDMIVLIPPWVTECAHPLTLHTLDPRRAEVLDELSWTHLDLITIKVDML